MICPCIRFAIELNETLPNEKNKLPCTDTRFRPDQRLLEEGQVRLLRIAPWLGDFVVQQINLIHLTIIYPFLDSLNILIFSSLDHGCRKHEAEAGAEPA